MSILKDLDSVFERDPAARNKFEIITCYPGAQAMFIYRITNWLWHKKLKWIARFLSSLARILTGIEIHPAATIGERFFIDHGTGVVIGETTVIGDDCTVYHGVTLGGTSWEKGKRHPTLKNNVVIGAGAKILGPITLGTGVRVGSNSVVVKDIADHETVVGVPGRLLSESTHKSFDAYGVSSGEDPTVERLNHLEQQLKELKELSAKAKESNTKESQDEKDTKTKVRVEESVDDGVLQEIEETTKDLKDDNTKPKKPVARKTKAKKENDDK